MKWRMKNAAWRVVIRKHQKQLVFVCVCVCVCVCSPGAPGRPAHPQRQRRVSPQVPAQTCNGVAKVSLSFNPPNLAAITPQLAALPCHRKQSGTGRCSQPLASSFFFLTSSYMCQGFSSARFFVKYCRGAWRSDVLERNKKDSLCFFSPAVIFFFAGQWCVSSSLLCLIR